MNDTVPGSPAKARHHQLQEKKNAIVKGLG